ncbi:MAG: hypothetical protein R2878_01745 [Thermoleophilia bacterium]
MHLNGRRITPVLRRRSGTRLVLRLNAGRHPLRTGENAIAVDSRRGSRTDHDVIVFSRTRARAGLGVIAAPRANARVASAPVIAVLRVPRATTRVLLWLNGRRIPESQWEGPWRGGRVRTVLTAADGLRHGRNVLRMVAHTERGHQITSRRFTVTGSVPLAVTGAHRRTTTNEVVTLRGAAIDRSGGRTAREQSDATYRWTLSVPPGSLSTLSNPSGRTPTFVPDLPGRYTAFLTVTTAAGTSAPVAHHTDVLSPGLTPLSANGSLDITIGGTTHAHDSSVASPAARVLAVSRSTGAPVPGWDMTFAAGARDIPAATDLADTGKWGGSRAALHSDALVIAYLQGAWYVAVPGGVRWTVPGDLHGYLGSTQEGFTYLNGDHSRATLFSTDAPGVSNTITVGDAKYTMHLNSLHAGATGGYQVLRLDATTLAPIAHTVVWANDLDDAFTATDTDREILMVASLGRPGPTIMRSGVPDLVGASQGALSDMSGDDRYGLIVAPDSEPIEVGSVIQRDPSQAVSGDPGPVQAIASLSRRPTGRFGAGVGQRLDTPGARTLADVAFSAPVAWPAADTPGKRAALAWFARQLGMPGDDPRASYATSFNIDTAVARLETLATMPASGGPASTSAEYGEVFQALRQEMYAVSQVRTFATGLTEAFDATNGQRATDEIGAISQSIQNAVRPPAVKHKFSILRVLSGVMLAAGKIAPQGGAAFTVVGEALSLANEFGVGSPSSGSDPTLVVSQTATALQADVAERLSTNLNNVRSLRDAIVTDHDRLMAAYGQISDGHWRVTLSDTNAAQRAFRAATAAETWKSLLNTTYDSYFLEQASAGGVDRDTGVLSCRLQHLVATRLEVSVVPIWSSVPARLSFTADGGGGRGRYARVIARPKWGHTVWMSAPDVLPGTIWQTAFGSVNDDSAIAGLKTGSGIYPPHLSRGLVQRTAQCTPKYLGFRFYPERWN